jgi:hypothetical protein
MSFFFQLPEGTFEIYVVIRPLAATGLGVDVVFAQLIQEHLDKIFLGAVAIGSLGNGHDRFEEPEREFPLIVLQTGFGFEFLEKIH